MAHDQHLRPWPSNCHCSDCVPRWSGYPEGYCPRGDGYAARTRKSGRRVTRTDHMATMRARLTGREIETYAAWQYKRHQQLREIGRKFYEDTRRTLVQIIAEAQGVGGWPIVSVTREELLKKYGEGDEPK